MVRPTLKGTGPLSGLSHQVELRKISSYENTASSEGPLGGGVNRECAPPQSRERAASAPRALCPSASGQASQFCATSPHCAAVGAAANHANHAQCSRNRRGWCTSRAPWQCTMGGRAEPCKLGGWALLAPVAVQVVTVPVARARASACSTCCAVATPPYTERTALRPHRLRHSTRTQLAGA